MTPRLTWIVLALVLAPTALLSLAAGRMLKDWETVLRRRIERNAINAVVETSSRLRAQTDGVLDEMRSALTDTLARGGGYEDIARTVAALPREQSLIAEAYLFMNPFGFVYPRETGPDEERLIQRLREALAVPPPERRFTLIRDENRLFAFAPLQRREGLFAGFRLEPDTFRRRFAALLTLASGGDFALTAQGPGLTGPDGAGMRVGAADRHEPVAPESLLHVARLAEPFDFIEVTVHAADPVQIRRTGAWQARLAGWGILLLAGIVLLGAVLMLREAGAEIRRARDRSDFVMSVSHDLRTPVASMKMLAESLYLDTVPDPEKRRAFLAAIVSECGRLADMIERVLFFVRQERQALAYVFHPCEPGPILEEAVAIFRQRLAPEEREEGGRDEGGNLKPEGRDEGGNLKPEGRDLTTENAECAERGEGNPKSEIPACLGEASLRSRKHEGNPKSGMVQIRGTHPSEDVISSAARNLGRRPLRGDSSQARNDKGCYPHAAFFEPCLKSEETDRDRGGVALEIREPLPVIRADRDMLIKVVLNLLDNAVKYGRAPDANEGTAGPVAVATASAEPWRGRPGLRIAVRDRGPGVAPDDRRRIFRKFQRGAAPGSAVAGAGLGLSICRDIVRAHGGRIEVGPASDGRPGAEFRVWLPGFGS